MTPPFRDLENLLSNGAGGAVVASFCLYPAKCNLGSGSLCTIFIDSSESIRATAISIVSAVHLPAFGGDTRRALN